MQQQLRPAFCIFAALTVVTGLAYPALVTVLAQFVFPVQANGSLIEKNNRAVGSALIGQAFDGPGYFWGRPSATTPGYHAGSSTGSNLGPTNPALVEAVRERTEAMRQAHPGHTGAVPLDLVTASGSGLDPHVSPAAAEYQVARVARARGWTDDRVRQLVAEHTEARTLGVLGEPRVNVLRLNLALDDIP